MSEPLNYAGKEIDLPPIVRTHLASKGIVVEPFASSIVLAFTPQGGGETYRLRVLRPQWDAMLAAMCRMTGETFVQSAPRQDETP